jgi:hypothetical protein
MADFPIGSFLYWRLEQKNKYQWPVYEFIRDFDDESPHNPPANMAGIMKDITLVFDGSRGLHRFWSVYAAPIAITTMAGKATTVPESINKC